MLSTLLLGGLMGLLGQGVRTVVGFRTALDAEMAKGPSQQDLFRAARILVSLFIGFLAGIAATLVIGVRKVADTNGDDVQLLLGIATAGYAGTDFLEGFFGQFFKQPIATPRASPSTSAQAEAAANSPQRTDPAPASAEEPATPNDSVASDLTEVKQTLGTVHDLLLATPTLHAPGSPQEAFKLKAPKIMRALMQDFDLQDFQAAGVLGNIGHECLGFTQLQEIHPISGRGGYGWCQWTGPRRRSFEAFCSAHGLKQDSDEANYGYLVGEFRSDFRSTVTALRSSRTLEDAVVAFLREFEKPKVLAAGRRLTWGQLALQAYRNG